MQEEGYGRINSKILGRLEQAWISESPPPPLPYHKYSWLMTLLLSS